MRCAVLLWDPEQVPACPIRERSPSPASVPAVSDTVLRMYGSDPEFRPDDGVRQRAKRAAEALFPGADQIDIEVYPQVTLIDCGGNLSEAAVLQVA